MSGSYEDRLAVALSELHAAHPLLNAEVAAYPTPISGCDVQFNRLLSDRTRIANALQALSSYAGAGDYVVGPEARQTRS